MGELEKLYAMSPVWIQNLMCSIRGGQIVKERFNNEFYAYMEELRLSHSWSAERIIHFKEEQTYKILDYAYRECPFYKKYYDDHHVSPSDFKALSDIEKFPIITKDLVRNNYYGMVAVNYPKENLIPSHTSGSSGKALDFYYTRDFIPYLWAIWWRFREQYGVHIFDRHLNCTGKLIVPIDAKTPPYWRINKPMNQWLVNMQHITPEKIPFIVDMINREDFVYPSIIYAIALCIKECGLQVIAPPKYIFTGAEKMYGNQKRIIEEVFPGVVCTDHYGMSEGVCNASKCKCGVYHEDFEIGLMECEEKHWISETQYEGDILGTTFRNYGMPLIRYRIGDTAVWDNSICTCGLESPTVIDIQGRSEDFVITPEGTRIQRFDYLFKDTTDIKECQVAQQKLGCVIFRIVKRENYSTLTEQRIREEVKRMISPTIECRFEYVNEIERTASGKFKAVVSEMK